ncbi:MAG TPA: crotonase/enoyl-CoA hydratase family protein [Alphaproteobacteria bacterium]
MANPATVSERHGDIAVLRLDRPEKRNAVNDALAAELDAFFSSLPGGAKAVVLCAAGPHFCAGLDLTELTAREPIEVAKHSRMWHAILDKMQYGGVPVIAAMQGAVIGGGIEIAAAAHIRVADATAFYELPEGRRGIFTGGGGSVRVGRIIGTDRLIEMMLTGRRYDAEVGQRLGLSHYLVPAGEAFAKAMALAATVAGNAAISNYMILNALPRIAEAPAATGLFLESLAAAMTLTGPDAEEGIAAFLEKRAPKFGKE